VSTGSQSLSLTLVHDRATVFVDKKFQGIVQRGVNISVTISKGSQLDILVENMGRVNHGKYTKEFKGITQPVRLGTQTLSTWQMFSLPFTEGTASKVSFGSRANGEGPSLFRGTFSISGNPLDTFVNMNGWGKGIALINGFNLGRYWWVGPQHTLYLPAPVLKSGQNELIIFEVEGTKSSSVVLQTTPILS